VVLCKEAFGGVVQGEADDEQGAECPFTKRECRADRQPLAEIVKADPDRNEERDDASRG
jgi:hypothetical protein